MRGVVVPLFCAQILAASAYQATACSFEKPATIARAHDRPSGHASRPDFAILAGIDPIVPGVRLVPEPASLLILGVGLLVATAIWRARVRRARRKARQVPQPVDGGADRPADGPAP